MSDVEKRARLGELADDIEEEMRRVGVWNANPPSEQRVLEGGAFGLGTVAFDTWVQVVLVRRLRQAAEGSLPIPRSSSVSAQATREWDGDPTDREPLMDLLRELDSII